jgi:hypothetical protein
MNRSESISKIAAALLKAQASMGNASKGASNPYFRSSYADLNAIREVVTPALNANGITVLQPTTTLDGKSYVETTLLHESGEFLSSLTEIVTAKQNDPQAAGSGISYARRYGLQSFLSVGAADDDGEAAMGRGKSSSLSPAQTAYAAKQASKAVTTNVGVTGDVSEEGTSSVAATTTVASSAPATSSTPKKVPFNKPGASKAAATTPASSGGGWS